MGRMSRAKVEKGQFAIVDHDGVGPRTFVFHFNPTELSHGHPSNWVSSKIAGQSHPVFQWGGSGEEIVAFTLRLDGDRGRIDRTSAISGNRPSTANSTSSPSKMVFRSGGVTLKNRPSSTFGSDDPASLSIQEDLNWFRRFSYPGLSGSDITSPRKVMFSLGKSYQALEAILEVGDVKVLMWTPAMEPIRADVPIKLKAVINTPVFRDSIYGVSGGHTSGGGGGGSGSVSVTIGEAVILSRK